MSYSVWLRSPPPPPRCPTCGRTDPQTHEPQCPDPTYNLAPIFDLALTGEPYPSPEVSQADEVLFCKPVDRPRGLHVLHGRVAGETLAGINAALDRMQDDRLRERFLALQSPNGWGTLDDAIVVMRRYKELAEEFPANVWEIR